MSTQRLFPFFPPARTQQRCWWLLPGLVVLFLFAGLDGLAAPTTSARSQTSSAQTHGCAPDVPPAVSGTIPAQALPGEMLINEALTQPNSNWNCSEPATVFSQADDSWIEIYNPQKQALNLYAAHAKLSLDGGSTSTYFPFGTAIAAGGFLVIFPLEKQTTAVPARWNLILSIDNITIDQAALPQLQPDQAYARVPDGSTTWLYAGLPTIDASNNSAGHPVAQTPTPAKMPKATSTPAARRTATAQAASSGTQPAWGTMKFPTDPSPALTDTPVPGSIPQTSDPPQNPPIPQSNSPNGWVIILPSTLVLAFLGIGIWIRRLFRPS